MPRCRRDECAAYGERRVEECATASQSPPLAANMQPRRCPGAATRWISKAARARGTAAATAAAGDRKSGAAEAATNRPYCCNVRLPPGQWTTFCRFAASTVRSRLRMRLGEIAQRAQAALRLMMLRQSQAHCSRGGCACEWIAARQRKPERVSAGTSNMHSALDACEGAMRPE